MTDRIRNVFVITTGVLGLIFVCISFSVGLLGVDLTPGFGLIQMVQLLVGISLLTLCGFVQIHHWRNDEPRSLQADIGVRLGATGLVFAFISGLSDLIGIGTHVGPNFERPFVGPFQLVGLGISAAIIIVGMILFYTSKGNGRNSLLEFIAPKERA